MHSLPRPPPPGISVPTSASSETIRHQTSITIPRSLKGLFKTLLFFSRPRKDFSKAFNFFAGLKTAKLSPTPTCAPHPTPQPCPPSQLFPVFEKCVWTRATESWDRGPRSDKKGGTYRQVGERHKDALQECHQVHDVATGVPFRLHQRPVICRCTAHNFTVTFTRHFTLTLTRHLVTSFHLNFHKALHINSNKALGHVISP